MNPEFMIYGANGYTGALILDGAIQRGYRPVIAGRSRGPIQELGFRYGVEWRVFSLDDSQALVDALREVPQVLHCAGPFVDTAARMVEACLETGTHYIDITGEIPVIEYLAGLDGRARQAGIMISPGMGFDVVPGDCLARGLHRQIPTATHLSLAFEAKVRPSRGTLRSAIRRAHRPGMVRENGELKEIPAGSLTREIDFGAGPRRCVAIPWGDLAAAYRSTGIPNIVTYMSAPRSLILLLELSRALRPLLAWAWLRRQLSRTAGLMPSGPDEDQRKGGKTRFWGQVRDDEGRTAEARLEALEAYDLTVEATLAAAAEVLAGGAKAGFMTPAIAFGEDFISRLPGVRWLGEVGGSDGASGLG